MDDDLSVTENWNFPQKNNNINEMNRTDIPTYHHYPQATNTTIPYKHLMKRPGNNPRMMEEIFGNKQNYSSMEELQYTESNSRDQENKKEVLYKHPTQFKQKEYYSADNPYVPKMKYMDSINQNNINHNKVNNNVNNNSSQITNYKENIYNAILEYFPMFTMYKTNIFNNHSVYKGLIECLLCNGTRFIVAIVENDNNPIGSIKQLSNIAWTSFQTRYEENGDIQVKKFGIQGHTYAKPAKTILDDAITLTRTKENSLVYNCDNLPLEIEILKQNKEEDYAERGTVASSLELFNTIITFI
jgi:hypothetical protein